MNNEALTIEQIEYIMNQAALQVQVAMLLSLSTLIVLFMVTAFALNWKKTGMVFVIAWGIVTAMVSNGHSQIIGPLVALIGFASLTSSFLNRPKKS